MHVFAASLVLRIWGGAGFAKKVRLRATLGTFGMMPRSHRDLWQLFRSGLTGQRTMKHSPVFENALKACRTRLAERPDFQPLKSIEKQLEYLIELDQGKRSDWQLMQNLNLGLLAVREFEPDDMEFAELIYQATHAAEEVRFGR